MKYSTAGWEAGQSTQCITENARGDSYASAQPTRKPGVSSSEPSMQRRCRCAAAILLPRPGCWTSSGVPILRTCGRLAGAGIADVHVPPLQPPPPRLTRMPCRTRPAAPRLAPSVGVDGQNAASPRRTPNFQHDEITHTSGAAGACRRGRRCKRACPGSAPPQLPAPPG